MAKPLDIRVQMVGTEDNPPGEGIRPGSGVGEVRNHDLLPSEEGGKAFIVVCINGVILHMKYPIQLGAFLFKKADIPYQPASVLFIKGSGCY